MEDVREVRLSREEVLVREKVLVDLKVRTIKRNLFRTLRRKEVGARWDLQGIKARALALVIEPVDSPRSLWYFILLENKVLISLGRISLYRIEAQNRWVLDLPRIGVV